MKLLFIFLFCLFTISSCCTPKHTTQNENTATLQEPAENVIILEYIAISRGFFSKIEISKNLISISKKREKIATPVKLNDSEWYKILKLLKPISLENLQNIEVPSKKFLFDGAAITTLKITSNGKTYETRAFDHGNPPKEIASLVKEMLSISQNIE